MGIAGVEELRNLADNWCYDNVREVAPIPVAYVVDKCVSAYQAGYEQALADLKDELR